MTDRELLEQISARLDQVNNRLETFHGEFVAFRQTTGENFTRVFDEFKLVHKLIETVDRRIDLVLEELVGVKIQTKSRMDRVEKRLEQLEQR